VAVRAGGFGESACAVIAVAGALAQGQGFLGDAVVAVKAEGGDVAQRVGDLDEVASGVVQGLGGVAQAVGGLGKVACGVYLVAGGGTQGVGKRQQAAKAAVGVAAGVAFGVRGLAYLALGVVADLPGGVCCDHAIGFRAAFAGDLGELAQGVTGVFSDALVAGACGFGFFEQVVHITCISA